MLLVVTAIGVAVMGGSRLELLMSNNSYFQTDAYRNAEIALKVGLTNLPTTPNTLTPDPNILSNWLSNSFTTTSVTTPTGTGKYAVEYLGHEVYTKSPLAYLDATSSCITGSANFCLDIYRVWALGTDGKGATRLLQDTHTVATGDIATWDNIVEIQQ